MDSRVNSINSDSSIPHDILRWTKNPEALKLLERLEGLGSTISGASEEIEEERRVPVRIIEALKQAGVFRMTMPKVWGGLELDPVSQILALETLGRFNASVGWCAMIGSDGGYFTGFMDQEVGRAMYRDLDAVTASGVMPVGKAEVTEGGYQLSGRWSFGSGCQHATWVGAGALVTQDGVPVSNELGMPKSIVLMIPAEVVKIHDTWDTTGLRGTGSHDWSVDDVFVPTERSFDVMTPSLYREGPLYQLPSMFFWNFPGVALGVARSALDLLKEIALTKKNLMFGTPIASEAHVATAYGRAEAILASARSFVLDATSDAWQTLSTSTESLSPDSPFHQGAAYSHLSRSQRVRQRLAVNHVHESCAEVVRIAYKTAGGRALYRRCPLDRLLRDIHTIAQHAIISEKTYESAGRVSLGDDPDQPFF